MSSIRNLADAPPPPPSEHHHHSSVVTGSSLYGHRRSVSWDDSQLTQSYSPRFVRSRTNSSVSNRDHEEEKQAESLSESVIDEESVSVTSHDRRRAYSDGSLITSDDDTLAGNGAYEANLTNAPSSLREAQEPRYILGFRIPEWCCTKPSSTRISSFVVRYAPCFWCSSKRMAANLTVRTILLRLVILNFCFGAAQLGSSIFLIIVTKSNKIVNRNVENNDLRSDKDVNTPNLWNLNGTIVFAGMLGLVVCFVMLYSRNVIRQVNLPGALTIMWFMLWIIPLEIFAVISMFDVHGVTQVWVSKWWISPEMAWFRKRFCQPGTYTSLCAVPIGGLPEFETESKWCQFYYDSTACSGIRNSAQAAMLRYSHSFYVLNGGLGCGLVFLLVLFVKLLESIVTKPLVQSSRENNIPAWLALPFVGCFASGAILLYSPSSLLQVGLLTFSWVGFVFFGAGGLYFIAALLGWFISGFTVLNSRDKQRKSAAVIIFIALMILTVGAVATICAASVLQSIQKETLYLTDSQRGVLACSIGKGTCSFCGNDDGQRECPEWTTANLISVVQTQFKQAATLSAIFVIYSIDAIRFGFVLRKHVQRYQIAYV